MLDLTLFSTKNIEITDESNEHYKVFYIFNSKRRVGFIMEMVNSFSVGLDFQMFSDDELNIYFEALHAISNLVNYLKQVKCPHLTTQKTDHIVSCSKCGETWYEN